jgi:hypothetical protein
MIQARISIQKGTKLVERVRDTGAKEGCVKSGYLRFI